MSIHSSKKSKIEIQCSTSKNTKNILDDIKQALSLSEDESTQSSNLEISKASNESTLTDSSFSSKENNSLNEYLNSFDFFQFEQNFKKYYVDSSKNNNGNYDYYVKNALKLISLIPFQKIFINEKIKEISQNINFECRKYEFDKNKKLLILDLDETLIHSDLDFLLREKNANYDKILYFDSDEEKSIPLPLIIRPGMYRFLDYASENFDLCIFTASEPDYADTIINYIERNKNYFKMRLYRNNCIFIEPGLYIKDLRIFIDLKNMEDIIILDNSLFSFANQLNNGILITSFFDDKEDSFLHNVKDYLEYIKNEKDIREINKESFRFEEIKKDISRNNN